MIERYEVTIFLCIFSVIFGIILGNSAVFFFNRIPGKWLCDYGAEPDEEFLKPSCQRIKSVPWKYLFSAMFVVIALKVILDNPLYGIAILASCWLLLEMAIADIKYRIVPDQLVILLALTAIGHLPYNSDGIFDGLWGAVIGFGVMLLIGILGKLIYKKETLGGGDIKLFASLGLCLGTRGVLIVFVLTTLLSAAHFTYLLAKKRIKKEDTQPMVPYICTSSAIYLVILREMSYNIMVYL